MAIVFRSVEAQEDQIEIWQYIAANDPGAADRWLDSIEDRYLKLAESPKMGSPRPNLGKNIRSWTVGNYVIFYRSKGAGIEIIRVLHGAQDIESLFEVD